MHVRARISHQATYDALTGCRQRATLRLSPLQVTLRLCRVLSKLRGLLLVQVGLQSLRRRLQDTQRRARHRRCRAVRSQKILRLYKAPPNPLAIHFHYMQLRLQPHFDSGMLWVWELPYIGAKGLQTWAGTCLQSCIREPTQNKWPGKHQADLRVPNCLPDITCKMPLTGVQQGLMSGEAELKEDEMAHVFWAHVRHAQGILLLATPDVLPHVLHLLLRHWFQQIILCSSSDALEDRLRPFVG